MTVYSKEVWNTLGLRGDLYTLFTCNNAAILVCARTKEGSRARARPQSAMASVKLPRP